MEGLRVLVTGAGGQLGHELARALAGHDVVLLDRAALDVTDPDACARVIDAAAPEAIIHTAAWSDVDGCEQEPARATAVNVAGTQNVVHAAGDAHVVLISSDYVFDGTAGEPYDEGSAPNPVQVYGRTKLEAEHAVRAAARHTIARTAWLYGGVRADGARARNFVTTILRAAEGGPVDVVDDQVGSPSSARDVAEALVRVVAERAHGVLHVVNQGAVSRADFARAILEEAGRDPEHVRAVPTSAIKARPANRPAYAPLATPGWLAAGFEPLSPWHDALRRALPEILETV